MLENLLNTKPKKKLLNIFFTFPKRGFSAAELQEMTRATAAQVAQALREFGRAQVVNSAVKNQHRFYRINPHFRLYDELGDLVEDSGVAPEDPVAKKLQQFPDLKLAILSGVFTMQPQMTVDLLLVGERVNRLKLQRLLDDLEELIGQNLDYAVMDPAEYEYRRLMNDRFVRDILDYPHLVIFNNLKKS